MLNTTHKECHYEAASPLNQSYPWRAGDCFAPYTPLAMTGVQDVPNHYTMFEPFPTTTRTGIVTIGPDDCPLERPLLIIRQNIHLLSRSTTLTQVRGHDFHWLVHMVEERLYNPVFDPYRINHPLLLGAGAPPAFFLIQPIQHISYLPAGQFPHP